MLKVGDTGELGFALLECDGKVVGNVYPQHVETVVKELAQKAEKDSNGIPTDIHRMSNGIPTDIHRMSNGYPEQSFSEVLYLLEEEAKKVYKLQNLVSEYEDKIAKIAMERVAEKKQLKEVEDSLSYERGMTEMVAHDLRFEVKAYRTLLRNIQDQVEEALGENG